ncbi:MAG: vWA domain-containing protein [Acidimicrobiales bacterium]
MTARDVSAVAFASVLRAAGLDVPTGSVVNYGRAVAAVGVGSASGVYWAGRATLVRRLEDIPAYDRAFTAFFGGYQRSTAPGRERVIELHVDAGDDSAPDTGDAEDDERPAAEVQAVRWSPLEVLRHKDLARCSPDELDEAHRLMADLRLRAALRPGRRQRIVPSGRGRLDLRRTVRRSLRTGGEVLRPAATRPGQRPRRLVVLLDVSGSMEPYARAFARFAHAAVAGHQRGRVEVFALGTRLTRITRELASHDPDEALRRAAASVADWSGGTRLGAGLRHFNDEWGVRGLARGAVVAVLSDGWDRGDPDELAEQLARLRRVAHRVVWVNPLKASPGYAPLARGMAAALPYVDEFVEGHSVAALEDLVAVLAQ